MWISKVTLWLWASLLSALLPLGVVVNLSLLIFAKVLSGPLLKGIIEKQRVIIKDDICSLWLKMTKWNFKWRSQHYNLMYKGVFAHQHAAKWGPSALQRFFSFAFKWGLVFKWGIEYKQTSSEAQNITFQLIASVCTSVPTSPHPLIYHRLQMEPRELCIEAISTWFYLPLHAEFYWAIK